MIYLLIALATTTNAEYVGFVNEEGVKDTVREPNYSPYAGRAYPKKVLWGDTHLHTSQSLDARALGPIPGPEEAYRFARDEEIVSGTGQKVMLSRPLDWLVISDHSDAMGAMTEIVKGNPQLLRDPKVRDGTPVLVRLPELDFFDDKEGKPVAIHQQIGQRPIAAFGNSDGDLQMLQWTTAGQGPRFALYVHHTDAEREWAYDRKSSMGRLDKGLDEAQAKGWTVVDMKQDWKVIYPHEKK